MNVLQFIASMLVLIFIALAWRFLLPLVLILVSFFMWYILFIFVKGMIEGSKETVNAETEQ